MTDITPDHFQLKKNIPDLRAGDRVRVHQKIKEGSKERVQVFEGLIIKTKGGKGIGGSFTVRRISLSVGIEKTYPLHLPSIVKIEKVKSAKVRRAKLYYVRGLVGKKARRLKGEKDDTGVWEDVVEEEAKRDPEQEEVKNTPDADKTDKAVVDEDKAPEKKEEKTEEKKDAPVKSDEKAEKAKT